MNKQEIQNSHGTIWFVYDGQCPICNMAANLYKVRQTVGQLIVIDARTETGHPVLAEINERKLNLDEGMVIKFNEIYYQGTDALHLMALLGSDHGWFNRTNNLLFKSKLLSILLYPGMKATRNVLLTMLGIKQLKNLEN